MDYDEQDMIAYTIMRHQGELMTPFERSVYSAFLARWKAEGYQNPGLERLVRETTGDWGDPRIDEVLDLGFEVFSRNVADRVLREQRAQLILNRCPKCNRIVRTPKAKQCMWCYHDWH